eukprot:1605654-Ditylum_brightwellii.AAC.1
MGIETKVRIPKIREGWVGKSKGLKQVLYEHGFLDLENIYLYTKDGPKDESNKVLDDAFSLKALMAGCTDFVEETILLQHTATQMGKNLGISVVVDRTPKGHPELVGKGIEYTWANSKVRLALSTSEGTNLMKPKIQKFAARAHNFVAAYLLLSPDPTDTVHPAQVKVPAKLTMADIERGHKNYWSHCGVKRSDTKWCAAVALALLKN